MPSEHIHTVDPAGIVVYDPANYADYFVERPTKQDYARLQAERDRALSRPLKAGDVLDFEGPSLHPGALPPADYPAEPPEPSPHEPRPALAALLARNSPSRLGRGWALRLIDALQAGEDETAQVWRCEALRGNEAAGPVVLKLYHQALFEFPDPCESNPLFDGWNWIPASHKQEREAMAYSQLKAYQGRDLPLCYGFYRFVLPCGDAVVGVVLEDLVDEVTPLWDLIDQEERKRGFDMDKLDRLICAAFDTQHRLQNQKVLGTCNDLTDILVVKNSCPSNPRLIVVGFSLTQHYDDAKKRNELWARIRAVHDSYMLGVRPAEPWVWRKADQQKLNALLRANVKASPATYKGWTVHERARERSKLPYLVISWNY
ncbi:hypothetical protein DMC30DRAFT_416726 [Rhodotorula diobovata]|uniref:Uncharacterized protein n=1 Tax=Rhodotorula diobovata TaxID=5288 RepID=A0A5C5FY92_9BASI|nr:hypothetical protein DMC30DRAFT_416726 [Rhodotorula diobovata]